MTKAHLAELIQRLPDDVTFRVDHAAECDAIEVPGPNFPMVRHFAPGDAYYSLSVEWKISAPLDQHAFKSRGE